jgi:hypothetical protein
VFERSDSIYFLNEFKPNGAMWFEHIREAPNGNVFIYGHDSTISNIVVAEITQGTSDVFVNSVPFIDQKFRNHPNYKNIFKLTYANADQSMYVMNRFGSFIKKLSIDGKFENDLDLHLNSGFRENTNTKPYVLPSGGLVYSILLNGASIIKPHELIQLNAVGDFEKKKYLSLVTLDFNIKNLEILHYVEDEYVTIYGACNRDDASPQIKTYTAVFNLKTAREIESRIINENEFTTHEGPHLTYKSNRGMVFLFAPVNNPIPDYYNSTFKMAELDKKGKPIWQTEVDINTYRIVPWHLSKTSDNGWLAVGWCIQGDSNTDKPFVVKVDENGEVVFSKIFTIGNFSRFHVAKQLQNGDMLFVGTTLAMGNSADADFFTLRTNSKGEYLANE